jgi:hypothetical protein
MNLTALTLHSNQFLRELTTECLISEGYDPDEGGTPPTVSKFIGLWDTGATGSAISENVVKTLGLKPFTTGIVNHAGGQAQVLGYMINVTLPNGVTIKTIPVSGAQLAGADLLIGMDIIGLGDFAITHPNGGTKMTFQIPPTRDIDFVKEINETGGRPKTDFKQQMNNLTKGKRK